ncbi:MAG: hypothetical protein ACT4P5_20595 [Armatimonadota bacterium]
MICREDSHGAFRDPGAAQSGGYVLAVAGVLVAVALVFHPLPAGGFDERPSILRSTPWWGAIHIAIAAGFVLCVLGSLLLLISGGRQPRSASGALWWGAMAVGMIFFTGVADLRERTGVPLAQLLRPAARPGGERAPDAMSTDRFIRHLSSWIEIRVPCRMR